QKTWFLTYSLNAYEIVTTDYGYYSATSCLANEFAATLAKSACADWASVAEGRSFGSPSASSG
ncbi:MAG: hypothetical protein ACE5HA_09630, partial [Anaerolineae bacterium]